MEIYTIGFKEQHDFLRSTAAPILDINENVVQTANAMLTTMARGNGIGLAGPQVGLLQRIFVAKITDEDPLVFINPELIATSPELSTYEEGCLSIPKQYADVKRPSLIQVQAWNTRGRPFTLEANGLLATLIQHEIDHLNGILFIDRVSEREKKKILNKFDVELSDHTKVE